MPKNYVQCNYFPMPCAVAVCLPSYVNSNIAGKHLSMECSGTINVSCVLVCDAGFTFQDGSTIMNYSCSGRNVWEPNVPVRSCVRE